jgi:hypothetical protein
MSNRWFALACAAVGLLALFGTAGTAVALHREQPDPSLAFLGKPTDAWQYDRIVMGNGTETKVADAYGFVDPSEWEDYARDVVKSGGRFERVTCRSWAHKTDKITRCTPAPLQWQQAIAGDLGVKA